MARRTSARYFNARLTRAELIAGWCYLPFYLVVLSVLLQQLFAWLKLPPDAITLNIAYFAVNLAAVLVIFRNFLRQPFFGANFWEFLQACILGFVFYQAGTFAVQFAVTKLGGTIRTASRPLAYITAIFVFTMMHNWQYFGLHPLGAVLLSCLAYVPASAALCWTYEKAGTIWASITVHAIINAITFGIVVLP